MSHAVVIILVQYSCTYDDVKLFKKKFAVHGIVRNIYYNYIAHFK